MIIRPTKTPGIAIADQPSVDDLRGLSAEGYTGVVNLRHDGEPEQPLSTVEEGEQVRAIGIDYLHYGVGGRSLTEDGVGLVSNFLTQHAAGRVLVHCRKGSRAAALVLLHEAKAGKWSADEALAKGRKMGLEVDGGLKTMVEDYLRTNPNGP